MTQNGCWTEKKKMVLADNKRLIKLALSSAWGRKWNRFSSVSVFSLIQRILTGKLNYGIVGRRTTNQPPSNPPAEEKYVSLDLFLSQIAFTASYHESPELTEQHLFSLLVFIPFGTSHSKGHILCERKEKSSQPSAESCQWKGTRVTNHQGWIWI